MAKILSIEVAASQTRVIEADYKVKNPRVYKYFTITTPEGVYDDGFLRDNDDYASTLRSALKSHDIKTKQVVFSITSGKIATREVSIPAVKLSQVDVLVKANASDYFPIDLTDYEVVGTVLDMVRDPNKSRLPVATEEEPEEEDDEEEGSKKKRKPAKPVKKADDTPVPDKYKAMVMACSRNMLNGYKRLADNLGLHLVAIDFSGNSMVQLMRSEFDPKGDEGAQLVLKIEEHNTTAMVFAGGVMSLQRNIPHGIDDAVRAVQAGCGIDGLSYRETVNRMRKTCYIGTYLNGTSSTYAPGADSDNAVDELPANATDDSELMERVTDTFGQLIGNVSRVVDLYNSRNIDTPIETVKVVGMGGELSGIGHLFTNELGLKATNLTTLKKTNWPASRKSADGKAGLYVACIGAIFDPVPFVRDDTKVDASGKKKINVNFKLVTLFVVVVCLAIAVMLFTNSQQRLDDAEAEQTRLKSLEATYAPAQVAYDSYRNMTVLDHEVENAFKVTAHNSDGLVAFLTELEQTLPETAEVSAITANDTMATMGLSAASKSEAAHIIQSIRDMDSVRAVSVGSIVRVDVEEEVPLDEDGNPIEDYVPEEKPAHKLESGMVDSPDEPVTFSIMCSFYTTEVEEPGTLTADELLGDITGASEESADDAEADESIEDEDF